MIPEVGLEASAEVCDSIEAMDELGCRLVESGAESLILISPHAPLELNRFVAYYDDQLSGNFKRFRAPKTFVDAPLDRSLLAHLIAESRVDGFSIEPLEDFELDHGTTVPLYFLQRSGWAGPVIALGYSFLSTSEHLRFGECLRRAVDLWGRPIALVASGDLSHRLKPGAPAGYDPSAHLFDGAVVAAFAGNSPESILDIDPDLRKLAGECGYRSMLVAVGAARGIETQCEVLNYEAPFGVGYIVAQLINCPAHITERDQREVVQEESEAGGSLLPRLAREAVETYVLTGARVNLDCSNSLLQTRAACFVSLKTLAGELRGCIGTIEPMAPNLAEELVNNAIGAATRDPRFPPVSPGELSNLHYSVDVLSTPEPASPAQLEPRTFGVIVEDDSGTHRGLLLPDIEGVDTATQQLEIATRKAGILPGSPLRVLRFRVNRFREEMQTEL
jgi:AmmeMemoRadiSam system protein A